MDQRVSLMHQLRELEMKQQVLTRDEIQNFDHVRNIYTVDLNISRYR